MIRGGTQEAPTRLIAGSTRRHVRGTLGWEHTPGPVQRRQEAPLAPAPPHAAGHLSYRPVPGALPQARLPVQAHKELPRALCAEGGMPAGLAPRSGAGQARVSVCVVPVYTGIGVDAAPGGGTRGPLQELVGGAPGAAVGARGGARQAPRGTGLQLSIVRYPVPLLGRCALTIYLLVTDSTLLCSSPRSSGRRPRNRWCRHRSPCWYSTDLLEHLQSIHH